MANKTITLNDIYANESCDSSVFKAVVMMAQEARYINEQSKLGNIELNMKPTTIAMHKFKENKLVVEISDTPKSTAELSVFSSSDDVPAETETDIFAETIAELDNNESLAAELGSEE